ncbi:MAG: nucleotidyl transferase AbiEii/AbiGii toxin family protein [Opitutaceae bacterium]|nr:nucleotidyl transferase AbiEii/AbiGii toxin family protein [Opitutaceae bacterium]
MKIEPNTVIRGALFPTEDWTLVPKAVALFGRSVTMRVVSLPDLYGGKLCAALDRQHPRDLFDVHRLFETEGLTDDIRRGFVVSLASHDRPMGELLALRLKDLRQVYAAQFSGMTTEPVTLTVLEAARAQLIERINAELTRAEREFMLSLKQGDPQWNLLGLPCAERLPGPHWKLYNLRKMDPKKHEEAVARLREKLGLQSQQS